MKQTTLFIVCASCLLLAGCGKPPKQYHEGGHGIHITIGENTPTIGRITNSNPFLIKIEVHPFHSVWGKPMDAWEVYPGKEGEFMMPKGTRRVTIKVFEASFDEEWKHIGNVDSPKVPPTLPEDVSFR
jgi:hypothetical protein